MPSKTTWGSLLQRLALVTLDESAYRHKAALSVPSRAIINLAC